MRRIKLTAIVNIFITLSAVLLVLVFPWIYCTVPSGFHVLPVNNLQKNRVTKNQTPVLPLQTIQTVGNAYRTIRTASTAPATENPTMPMKVANPFNRTYRVI